MIHLVHIGLVSYLDARQRINATQITVQWTYTPHEGLNLTNRKTGKLGVFGWKLGGSHSLFSCYFDTY